MIEVWEKLDCESVGAAEIEAIETVIESELGKPAVDSPMIVARLLADEGAELRHAEIMELYLRRAAHRPYDAVVRNILRIEGLGAAAASMRDLENVRRKFVADNDRDGLRHVRQAALDAKADLARKISDPRTSGPDRHIAIEVSEWLSHWLRTPELFADWVEMRQRSKDFVERFGDVKGPE